MRRLVLLLPIVVLALCVSCTKTTIQPASAPVVLRDSVRMPSVLTDSAVRVTDSSARIYATIADEGTQAVISAGLAWDTTPNPTAYGNHAAAPGFGPGSFYMNLPHLKDTMQYYVRAYATSAKGTTYSPQLSFTTRANYNPAKLLARTWKLTAQTVDPALSGNLDLYAVMAACQRDNLLTYDPTGTYRLEEGATKCNATDPALIKSGRYVLNPDFKHIILTPSSGTEAPISVQLLTATQLKVEQAVVYPGNANHFKVTSTYRVQ